MGVTIETEGDWREELLWYAVQTRSKSEHIAAASIKQFGEIEVYCPRLKFQRPTARGKVWYTEALFPGYLFARFEAAEYLRAVRHANAVSKLLQFGEDYAVLDDAMIAHIRSEMGGEDLFEVKIVPEVGDDVEIAAGPFRGVKGVVTSLLSGSQRVRILLDFLGRTMEAEIPAHNVRTDRNPQGSFADPT